MRVGVGSRWGGDVEKINIFNWERLFSFFFFILLLLFPSIKKLFRCSIEQISPSQNPITFFFFEKIYSPFFLFPSLPLPPLPPLPFPFTQNYVTSHQNKNFSIVVISYNSHNTTPHTSYTSSLSPPHHIDHNPLLHTPLPSLPSPPLSPLIKIQWERWGGGGGEGRYGPFRWLNMGF